MELFNVYNNYIIRSLPFIYKRFRLSEDTEEVSLHELEKVFDDAVGPAGEKIREDALVKKSIFEVEKEDAFIAKIDKYNAEKNSKNNRKYTLSAMPGSQLPIIFSRYEKEYIKLMLEDPEARCFMSEELVKKLEDALKDYDVSYISENYIQRSAEFREINEEVLRSHLLVIAEALRQHKKISYVYASREGKRDGIVSPYKLMYSLRDRVLRLAACPDDDHSRFILMNLDRFIEVELTEIDIDSDHKNFYRSQLRKLIIRVENDKSKKSAERCMRVFSSYARKTIYNKEEDNFTIEVDFYRFDKEMIIKDIISLGSSAEVIEVMKPGETENEFVKDDDLDLRSEVIDRIKKMYDSMN